MYFLNRWPLLAVLSPTLVFAAATRQSGFQGSDASVALKKSACGKELSSMIAGSQAVKWSWKKAIEPGGGERWLALSTTSSAWGELVIENEVDKKEPSKSSFRLSDGRQTEFTRSGQSCLRSDKASTAEIDPEWTSIAEMTAKQNTIFYSFSNGMPLSGKGLQAIASVAAKNHFSLVVVSDGSAREEDLRELKVSLVKSRPAIEKHISFTRVRDASLAARGLFNQYPSVLSVVGGQWETVAYNGYKPENVWNAWLKKSETARKAQP